MPEKKAARWIACLAIALSVPVTLIGCGGSSSGTGPEVNATVSGTVTSDGKPVSNAMISFEKMGFGAWGTKLGEDGTYEVKLAAGEFVVTVVPIPPPTTMNPGEMPKIPKREEIPKAYRTGSKTKAQAVINEGSNTFDLSLK